MPFASPVTDVLQGWGTAAGALFAALALIAAIAAYRLQNRQIKDQQSQIADQQVLNRHQGAVLKLQADELRGSLAERRRAQVSKVFISLSHHHDSGNVSTAGQIWPTGVRSWSATVENRSELPVYQLRVRWTLDDQSWIHMTPANDPPNPFPRLGPADRQTWTALVEGQAPAEESSMQVIAEFRDANEVWWRIRPDGLIKEIDSSGQTKTTTS